MLCLHLLIKDIGYSSVVILLFMILCTFNFSLQQQNHGMKDVIDPKRNKTNYLNSLVEKFSMRIWMPKKIHAYV